MDPPARRGTRRGQLASEKRVWVETRQTEGEVSHLISSLDRIADLHLMVNRSNHHGSNADGEDGSEDGRVDLDDGSDV